MIYEPTFLDTSHGFRPGRSCHTALRETQTKFKSAAWIIEGDISKCFDSIDHAKLINLIETKIHDRQFTTLIKKSLKCGYFEFRHWKHDIVGTPQGSIISPILSNIFLHQLDEFIRKLREELDIGTRPRVLSHAISIKGKIYRAKKANKIDLVKTLFRKAQKLPYTDYRDPNYKRLR